MNMNRHMLTSISKVEMTNDGKRATLHLLTESATAFTLEVETAQLDMLVSQLLVIAKSAGQLQSLSERPAVGAAANPVPVPTDGMGLMMGPPGHALLVFRVGCVDLALQIENSQIRPIGQQLLTWGTRLATEPTRAQ